MRVERKRLLLVFLLLVLSLTLTQTILARTPDPSGASTGSVSDLSETSKTNLEELANFVGHNKIAINMLWVLITGFLVMFMQAGFALLETGLIRAKNVAHTMAMNFLIYAIGMIGFWICGFAFMFGGVGPLGSLGGYDGLARELTLHIGGKTFGLLGLKGFFLSGSAYDVAVYALFLFQMVFMDTAATIPTGAMAERWRFIPFIIFGFFISMFTYPIFGSWVWGGGWLSQLGVNFGLGHGFLDFAGSSVVHMVGGITGLAGAKVLGPRIGKFNKDGTPNPIPGHDITMVITGTFILAFGWFGFNAGSTLAGGDLRISVIAVNTMIASAAGAFGATILTWIKLGKPDPSMMANGLLAGLVGITAPCAFVNSGSAFIIGLIAGFIVIESVFFVERVLKIDDPVGAISVHGVCGTWGCLSLGLFADGSYGDGLNGIAGGVRGLFYGGYSQFASQIIGVLVNLVFVFTVSYAFFKLLDKIVGLRVDPISEIEGLDISEMGTPGYTGIKITREEVLASDIVNYTRRR